MKKLKQWIGKHWIALFIIAMTVALFAAVHYFIHAVQQSYSEGELRPVYFYHHDKDNRIQLQHTPQQVSVNDIQPWMTFDYINVVFKIPSVYFKNVLGINDSRYPNIRLDWYARAYHIDQTVLLTTVRKYVATYTAH